MANTRQPVKALNQSKEQVRANAAAEKARKAASKAELAKATAARMAAEVIAANPPSTQAEQPVPPAPEADHSAEDAANALVALRVDYDALHPEFEGDPAEAPIRPTFEMFLAEQGLDPAGFPLKPVDAKAGPYTGPMLALKTARLHYTKMDNGILANGDRLALICGKHSRAETVAALIKALKLPGNPYTSLNPGQQSMNLRNRARQAMKRGELTFVEIEAAFNTQQ